MFAAFSVLVLDVQTSEELHIGNEVDSKEIAKLMDVPLRIVLSRIAWYGGF